MYPVSEFGLQIIRGEDRSFLWVGTITLSDGTVVPFDMSNIVQGSGSLRSSCNAPGVGETVSTELSLQMYLNLDTESLKNAVIGLSCHVVSRIDLETWGDASAYEWTDVSGVQWGSESKVLSIDVPSGVFNVKKAKRTTDSIRITAYDNMQKFDVQATDIDTMARTPVSWLTFICYRCGVSLGMTNAQLSKFPNGTRSMTYADVDSTIGTYRDMLSRLASALCAVAMMDRSGKLILVPCISEPILEITPSDRYTSEFEDYKTLHTGIYSQYRATGIQEYFTNAQSGYDTGSIIDLGSNPFLQISNDSIRKSAVQNIINKFADFAITPFEMTIPHDPTIDLMDVVSFTGSHAPSNAQAPITDIVRIINGDLNIRCEVAETAEGLLRTDKEISGGGISGDSESSGVSYGSSDFWLQIASYPSSSTSITTETDTTSITIDLTVDKTRTQIAWTGFYTLSADATVTAKVYADSTLIYSISDSQTSGSHVLNVTTGYEINEKQTVTFKVAVSISTGTMTMDSGASRLTVLGCGWGDASIDSGESLTLEEQLLEDLIDLLDAKFEDEDGNEIKPDTPEWEELIKELEDKLKEELKKDDNGESGIDPEDVAKIDDLENVAEYNPETGTWGDGTGWGQSVHKNAYNPDLFNTGAEVVNGSPKLKTSDTSVTPATVTGGSGNEYVEPTASSEESLPYKIKITTPATKLTYNSGETIDTTGMVVTAYTITTAVWTHANYPNGIVPLSELVLSPTKAP